MRTTRPRSIDTTKQARKTDPGGAPIVKTGWRYLPCPSSKHLGRLSLFRNRGSGSSLFDVKPLFVDGSSGGSGLSVF